MKNKKKRLPIILTAVVMVIAIAILMATGYISFDTYSGSSNEDIRVSTIDDLKNDCYYVWHDETVSEIEEDLENGFAEGVFVICPEGEINWKKDDFIRHTVWFTSDDDTTIPTLYEGDSLIYISSTTVPFAGITWERYSDYGYTVGVANMEGDESGHYRIINNDGNGYKGYLCEKSDAYAVNDFEEVAYLFLDKIGKVPIRDNNVSEGGTVLGLAKDQKYVCEWYTGTYYQDYELTANVHTFSFLESFTTYDYEFLHSNCIEITIPEWFKSGYYYVQNAGMFRYVSSDDSSLYNGEAYDENIDWNDPIILYNEEGRCIYDPSTGTDYRDSDIYMNLGNGEGSNNGDLAEFYEEEDVGDAGLEIYGLEDDEMVEE